MIYHVTALDYETDSSELSKTDYKVFSKIKDAEIRCIRGEIVMGGEKRLKMKNGESADIIAVRLYEVEALDEKNAQEIIESGGGLKLRDSEEIDPTLDQLLKNLPNNLTP